MADSGNENSKPKRNWQLFFDKTSTIVNLLLGPAAIILGLTGDNPVRRVYIIVGIFSLIVSGHIWLIFLYKKQIEDNQETVFNAREANKRVREFLRDIDKVSQSMHAFAHGFRDHMLKLVHDIETIDYRGNSFRDFIRESLDYIANVFSRLTRDDCSACIKLIIPAGGERTENYVYTYERDQNSYYQRRGTDTWLKEYKLSDFTPFKDIQGEGKRFSICHNLEKDVTEGTIKVHEGRLPSVFRDYNAFCIVPIRAHEKGKKDPQIIAFLCVDNMYGGFNENIVYIAAAFADILYYAFLINDMAGDPRVRKDALKSSGAATKPL